MCGILALLLAGPGSSTIPTPDGRATPNGPPPLYGQSSFDSPVSSQLHQNSLPPLPVTFPASLPPPALPTPVPSASQHAYQTSAHAAAEICEGLSLLQHRGQDACGIVTCGPGGRFYQTKGNGMVRDVFRDGEAVLEKLIGGMGIGHVRYPTAGSAAHSEAQPFYVNSPYGIVFAHNGNLINTAHLRYYLDHYAHRHINTDSDSELLLNILADTLQKTGKFRIDEDDIFRALGGLMQQCHGAYACVAMVAGFGIVAFRDPNGIRPVGWGRRLASKKGEPERWDYVMASESVVADAAGYQDWQDVKPGEAVIITRTAVSVRQVVPPRTFAPDIFEYVYLARPDSVIDGISVYRSRMAMGDYLAGEVERVMTKHKATVDVVIPVPDTSRVAALQCAQKMGIPFREGFVKNRYVGRTFIMPGQQQRQKNVRRKLNAMALEFSGKNVLLVDDSIVRGTTSKEIVQMARDAGAKRVYFASCAPPIRFSNVYGIDMPSRRELVAHGRSNQEISKAIGADLVVFQTLDDLVKSCGEINPSIERFECSVFTGEYVTGGVDEEYLQRLENLRNDKAKAKKPSLQGLPSSNVIGLHNESSSWEAPDEQLGLSNSAHPLHQTSPSLPAPPSVNGH
ncbi:Amidophosphoribosyltransferase [Atractiella rhizophila]|nr:Amidophosphoribosyltransferase [Atractiella rhizophila]